MADIAREMEDFKAANRTFGGEWKLEMKGNNNNSSSNQPSSHRSTPNPPQPARSQPPPPAYYKARNNKYRDYGYSSRPTWGVGNPELKRQRRVVKYKSYAVEAKLKSSLVNGFRWMKNKYCEIVRGY